MSTEHETLPETSQLSPLRVLFRILGYTRRYIWLLVLGMVGIIATQVLAVSIPFILRFVIDRGIERQDSDFMLSAGLLVVGLGILRGIAGFLGRYFTELQSHKIAYDLRNEFYDKVQQLPFIYHDKAQTGSLITRGISDVDEMQRFLAFGFVDGLNTIFIVLLSSLMMLLISPVLAAIVLLPLIPLLFRSYHFASFVEREWAKVMERLSNLGNHLQENLVGVELVRAFAREPYEIDKFGSENQRLFDQQLKVIRGWSNYIPFSATTIATSIVITLIVGGWMEQQGLFGITAGVIVQFNAYILMMSQPIRFSGFIIMLTNQGIASGRRVFEVLDVDDTLPEKADAIELPPIQGVLAFEDVNFRYADDLPYALQDINLTAKPGQVIALIGRTGAGKSSLVSLIPRFYDVTTGRVTIDGYDVRDITKNSLKRQIGTVLQESLLFSATIRENIAFGRADASEEDIIAAAKAANAHDFILEFPDGYGTLVGERGVTLSGGQRQRVAIARALLIDPRILILDDSTSSVDTETEHLIQEALDRLMEGRTTFIIAQRLSSVLSADEILVLQHGRIAERGQHDDLLALGGIYKEIYDLQLADQERVRREMHLLETGQILGNSAAD